MNDFRVAAGPDHFTPRCELFAALRDQAVRAYLASVTGLFA